MNIDKLIELKACKSACDWAEKQSTPQQAWNDCPDYSWMFWYVEKTKSRELLVWIACQCARLSLKYTKDARVEQCILITEAWTKGKRTIEEVKVAASSAYDACADAYDAAANAASAAANAASAAANAASAAAYAARAAAYDADADAYAAAAANAAAYAAAAANAAAYAAVANAAANAVTYAIAAATAAYAANTTAYDADADVDSTQIQKECRDIIRQYVPSP